MKLLILITLAICIIFFLIEILVQFLAYHHTSCELQKELAAEGVRSAIYCALFFSIIVLLVQKYL